MLIYGFLSDLGYNQYIRLTTQYFIPPFFLSFRVSLFLFSFLLCSFVYLELLSMVVVRLAVDSVVCAYAPYARYRSANDKMNENKKLFIISSALRSAAIISNVFKTEENILSADILYLKSHINKMVEMLCYDLLIKAELIRFHFSNRHLFVFHI